MEMITYYFVACYDFVIYPIRLSSCLKWR